MKLDKNSDFMVNKQDDNIKEVVIIGQAATKIKLIQ